MSSEVKTTVMVDGLLQFVGKVIDVQVETGTDATEVLKRARDIGTQLQDVFDMNVSAMCVGEFLAEEKDGQPIGLDAAGRQLTILINRPFVPENIRNGRAMYRAKDGSLYKLVPTGKVQAADEKTGLPEILPCTVSLTIGADDSSFTVSRKNRTAKVKPTGAVTVELE